MYAYLYVYMYTDTHVYMYMFAYMDMYMCVMNMCMVYMYISIWTVMRIYVATVSQALLSLVASSQISLHHCLLSYTYLLQFLTHYCPSS